MSLDNVAKAIANIYSIPAIINKRIGSSSSHDGKYIPDVISKIPGKIDLNIAIRQAIDYYNTINNTKNEHKEIAELKAQIGPLAVVVNKLQQMINKNEKSPIIINEFKTKTDELDTIRKRLGELTTSTSSKTTENNEKLALIIRGHKILSKYYTDENTARNLLQKIKQLLNCDNQVHTNNIKQVPVVINHDVAKIETLPQETTNLNNNNIEVLIAKYEAKRYLTPSQKKMVEDELKQREEFTPVRKNIEKLKKEYITTDTKNNKTQSVSIDARKLKPENVIQYKPEVQIIQENDEPVFTHDEVEILNERTTKITEFYSDGSFIERFEFNHTLDSDEWIHPYFTFDMYIREKRYKPYIRDMEYEEWIEFKESSEYLDIQEQVRKEEEYLCCDICTHDPEMEYNTRRDNDDNSYDYDSESSYLDE